MTSASRPAVVVFDVNETLSDLSGLAEAFALAGYPRDTAREVASLWFAAVLRDGFALAAAGGAAPFRDIGEHLLRRTMAAGGVADPDAAAAAVLAEFAQLSLHDDVPDGLRRLHEAGLRLVTLTNGSTAVSEQLFGRAGVRGLFEQLLSVDDAGVWKPARGAYDHAASRCGCFPEEMLLVAVHPWDIDGAARAGLRTAWLDRTGAGGYPPYSTPPELTVRSVGELADRLLT